MKEPGGRRRILGPGAGSRAPAEHPCRDRQVWAGGGPRHRPLLGDEVRPEHQARLSTRRGPSETDGRMDRWTDRQMDGWTEPLPRALHSTCVCWPRPGPSQVPLLCPHVHPKAPTGTHDVLALPGELRQTHPPMGPPRHRTCHGRKAQGTDTAGCSPAGGSSASTLHARRPPISPPGGGKRSESPPGS